MSAPAWAPPQALSIPGVAAEDPQVAMSADGDATVVWEQVTAGGSRIVASSKPAGGDWSTPTDVSALVRSAYGQQVAMDARGNTVVVWQQSGRIKAARHAQGGTWTPPVTLSMSGGPAAFPQVAMDRLGGITVVWQKRVGAHDRTQAVRRPFGRSWGPVRTLSGTFGDASRPQVAMDARGDTTVVWERDWADGGRSAAIVVRRPRGGGWTSPRMLSPVRRPGSGPLVAMNRRGGAVVAWGGRTAGVGSVQASVRPAGGHWRAFVTVSGDRTVSGPADLAMDSAGNATVTWHWSDGSNVRDQAARRPAGGHWGSPVTVSPAGTDSLYPNVAMSGDGTTNVVWTNSVVQGRQRPLNRPWGASLALSNGVAGSNAQVAMDAAGGTVVVWKYFDGTDDRVMVTWTQ